MGNGWYLYPLARADAIPIQGSSLFIINANGTGLVPLSSLPGGDFDSAWSPDGKTIAFTSLRSGKDGIYLYELVDNTVKRISSPVNLERRPAWSPDGKKIAYETRHQGKPQIWVMANDGADMREISILDARQQHHAILGSTNRSFRGCGAGDLQPGQRAALPGRAQGWRPWRRELRLSETIRGILDARYAPDGFWLAFTRIDLKGATSVYWMMSNGGNLTQIPGSQGGDFHPAWRPGGSK